MSEVIYLSLGDVIALHALAMERTGYAPAPLRDEGRLESAVMRPRMASHYENADVIRQAALLVVGVAQAHAFLDGNKRAAFAVGEVFLRINGRRITAESMEWAKQIESLATRSDSIAAATERFESWLRARSTP